MNEHIFSSAADILRSAERKRLVFIISGYYVVAVDPARPADATYDIEASRCRSPQQLVAWILHLCDKSWFTATHARDLIEVCARCNRFDVFSP